MFFNMQGILKKFLSNNKFIGLIQFKKNYSAEQLTANAQG